jgi:DNA-binding ferritin-like protein
LEAHAGITAGANRKGPSMDKSDKYVLKMEEQLKKWDAEVDKLAAAGEAKGVEARVAYQDCIKDLRAGRDEAHETFGQMRAATAEAGRQLQSKMRAAWHSMQKALEKATADLHK